MKRTAPRYGFGTEQRPEIARTGKNASPGAGTYEMKTVMGTDTKKSMSPKLSVDYKAKNDRLVPGPG